MSDAATNLMQAQGDRERALLAAARSVFVEQGFDASSISEIARRAGVASGTVYLYFPNKRTLLLHVLADFVTTLTSDIEDHLKDLDGHAVRLRYVIARHLQALIADSELSALFVREVHAPDGRDGGLIKSVKQRYASVLTRVLEEGMAGGALRTDISPALAQSIVFGGLEQLTLRTWTGRSTADGIVDSFTRLLLKPEQPAPGDAVLTAMLQKIDRISEKLGVTE